jgi:ketosteroid isomerase-like protein
MSRRRRLLALAGLTALAQGLYELGVRALLWRNLNHYRAGNPKPLQRTFADDVHFTFPGESSWRIETRDKREVERWQERFFASGLQLTPGKVAVDGPPWDTTIVLHFTDRLDDSEGRHVYANVGVIYGKVAWGKVVAFTVYEDTQKLPPLDEHLARTIKETSAD